MVSGLRGLLQCDGEQLGLRAGVCPLSQNSVHRLGTVILYQRVMQSSFCQRGVIHLYFMCFITKFYSDSNAGKNMVIEYILIDCTVHLLLD